MSYGWSFEKSIKTENRETVRRLVEYKGVTKTLAQWCKELHLTYGTVKSRLDNGWPAQKAFEQPIRKWPAGEVVPVHADIGDLIERKLCASGE